MCKIYGIKERAENEVRSRQGGRKSDAPCDYGEGCPYPVADTLCDPSRR